MFQLPENFRLHDATRRRLCLVLFAGLCLAPTAGVLAWGVSRMLPTHVRSEADRLSGQLGLKVALDGVRHPQPGVVVYEGLQVLAPESGRAIVRVPRLTATWRSTDRKAASSAVLELALEGAEIDAAGLARLGDLALRGLRQEAPWADLEVRVAAPEARLAAASGPWALTEVAGFLQPVKDGSHGQIAFRIAGIDTEKPISIRVAQDRSKSPSKAGLELSTGGGVLPCSLLATAIPGIERLGRQSGFRGSLWMNESGGHRQYSMGGADLVRVDLESAIGDRVGHTLTGTAQVRVDLARIADGRLEEASGSVIAGPGTVGRGLLAAAVECLGMRRGVEPPGMVHVVPYEQLAFALERIDSQGIRVRGTCPVPGPGSIMVDTNNRLLAEPDPNGPTPPVGALVRMLVPAGPADVPATRQADELMRVLPLPEKGAGADFGPTSLSHAETSAAAPGQ